MEKNKKKNKEDFILKKIRHFQGSVKDFATYWERKCEEGVEEESEETKELKKQNDDLNKAYTIVPVEDDEGSEE